MGFNIYYASAYNGMGSGYWSGNPSAAVAKQLIDDMVRVGLTGAGYRLFSLEGWRWSDATQASRAADGSMLPRPGFEDMAGLAAYAHAKGLLAGIYTDTGAENGCYTGAGSGSHIAADLTQFLDWGFDFLKLDHCGGNPNSGQLGQDGSRAEYQLWRQTIDQLAASKGKQLLFNIADWNDDRTPGWAPAVGHSWRTGTDIDCNFGCSPASPISWRTILRNFDKNDVPPAAGPGHWNDPDYLLIGMRLADGTNPLTDTEQRAYFSMWAIQAAPLMLATFPADLDPSRPGAAALREIVLNSEVIAVDQDALGRQGEKVREDEPGRVVYSKVLSGSGRRAALLLNRGETAAPITVRWEDLGLDPAAAAVRDLWQHADLGSLAGSATASVPPHGCVLLLVSGSEQARAPQTGWASLGGKLLGTPAAVWTDDGELSVFVRGLDNNYWVRRWRGSWEPSFYRLALPAVSTAPAFPTEKSPVELSFRGEPGVVALGSQLHLVGVAADLPYATEAELAVYHTYSLDGGRSWSGFENLGGRVHGRVTPVFRSAGTFDVLGRGSDGAVWRRSYTWGSGWSGWERLGGCARSGVAATSKAGGEVHVAVIGCDDGVWHGTYAGSGELTWERVGAESFSGTPGLAWDPSTSRLNVFARARGKGDVQQSAWSGGWSAWSSVGGCAKDGVLAVARPASLAQQGASLDVLGTGCNRAGLVSLEDDEADAAWQRTVSSR